MTASSEKYTIERYNYTNISRTIADAFGRIQVESFKDDKIIRAAPQPDCQFGTGRMPSLAEYEALIHKAKVFGKQARSVSRWVEPLIGSDPRQQLWMLKEKDTGKYMAASLWTLPEYQKLATVPLWQRAWYWLKSQWYKAVEFCSFFPYGNPFKKSGFFEEMEWALSNTGATKTPERVAELESLPPSLLAETAYPQDLSYYLFIMIVRTDTHGKGYGRKLLETAMSEVRDMATPPPNIDGPAKMTLLSAPTAAGFYHKLGFKVGSAKPRTLLDGEEVTFNYFYMNVD